MLTICIFKNDNIYANRPNTIKIAAGPIISRYYLVASKLCYFFKNSNADLICDVVVTNGTIDNLALLRDNKVDLAIGQSDIALDAFNGVEYYKDKHPFLELRHVLNLYYENFNILTKDDDQIKMFADLSGKRISYGAKDSASYLTYECVKEFYPNFNAIEVDLAVDNYAKKLCNGEIDALIIMAGHPSPLINLIANTCNIEFVTIEGDKLQSVLEHNPGFRKGVIDRHIYSGIAKDQTTIEATAILLTNKSFNAELLTNFINYFKCHIDSFKHTDRLLESIDNDFFTGISSLPLYETLMRK